MYEFKELTEAQLTEYGIPKAEYDAMSHNFKTNIQNFIDHLRDAVEVVFTTPIYTRDMLAELKKLGDKKVNTKIRKIVESGLREIFKTKVRLAFGLLVVRDESTDNALTDLNSVVKKVLTKKKLKGVKKQINDKKYKEALEKIAILFKDNTKSVVVHVMNHSMPVIRKALEEEQKSTQIDKEIQESRAKANEKDQPNSKPSVEKTSEINEVDEDEKFLLTEEQLSNYKIPKDKYDAMSDDNKRQLDDLICRLGGNIQAVHYHPDADISSALRSLQTNQITNKTVLKELEVGLKKIFKRSFNISFNLHQEDKTVEEALADLESVIKEAFKDHIENITQLIADKNYDSALTKVASVFKDNKESIIVNVMQHSMPAIEKFIAWEKTKEQRFEAWKAERSAAGKSVPDFSGEPKDEKEKDNSNTGPSVKKNTPEKTAEDSVTGKASSNANQSSSSSPSPKPSAGVIVGNILLGACTGGLAHLVYYIGCLIARLITGKWPADNPITFFANKVSSAPKIENSELKSPLLAQ